MNVEAQLQEDPKAVDKTGEEAESKQNSTTEARPEQSRSSLHVSDILIIASKRIIEKVTSPQARKVNPQGTYQCRTCSRA